MLVKVSNNLCREEKNIYISSDEKDMGNIMLNSDSIKCVEDMKKFKKKL